MKNTIFAILLTAVAAATVQAQDISVWDGSTEAPVQEGRTLYVTNAAQLAGLRAKWGDYDDGDQGYKGYTIKLTTDIDLNKINFNSYTIGWNDDNMFGGTFDGQGHIIRNLTIVGNDNNRGLFGKMDNGRVKNLKLVNVEIRAGDGDDCHIGAICGRMSNHSTIEHCAVVGGSVRQYESGNDEFGAICGYMTNNHNSIEYCYSDITVEADAQVGGLVGKVEQGDDHTSGIYHSYFVGKVIHHSNDCYASIAGERFGQPLVNNFYLYRDDGVRGTGYDGGSGDPRGDEIAACTDEQMKQPLLFSMYNDGYTLDSDEYYYPLNGYPELKVFLRYNVDDTFYNNRVGSAGDTDVSGYLKITNNENSTLEVSLEKTLNVSNPDVSLDGEFQPYFSDRNLCVTALGPNSLESMGTVNTVTIPATVQSVARPQHHQVQNAFILNGTVGAVKDGVLYDLTDKYLVTAPKSFETLTVRQQFADRIAEYAFENMTNLRNLYIDTYVPAGTLVDDNENPAPVVSPDNENSFEGCPAGLNVYVKDGTTNQLFYGVLAPGKAGYGYINNEIWAGKFYWEYEDTEERQNHIFSYFPVTRNPRGLSTLILGYPVQLPDGVSAWWAKSFEDGTIKFCHIGKQIVPALTPVLLTYEGDGLIYLSRYDGPNPGAATEFKSNLLKGSVDPGGQSMTPSEMMSNFYTLGRPSGDSSYDNLGFYQYHPKNNLLPSYVAWFAASDVPDNARLAISFDDGEITGITETEAATNRNHDYYSLTGQRVTKPTKGLYIVDGRKVFIP